MNIEAINPRMDVENETEGASGRGRVHVVMVAVLVDGSVAHFTLSLIAMMLSLNIDALRER